MMGAYTTTSTRPRFHERERIKIIFQYTLMLAASLVAGWLLPRFFGESFWQDAGSAVEAHFALPFSELDDFSAVIYAVYSYFKPTLLCIGTVAIFSFSSLNCLVSDGVLIYLGMRVGCTLSILLFFAKGRIPTPYRPSTLCIFLFILFKLLLIIFFWLYSIQAAKYSYQMRIYSQEGRALFPKKAVGALVWHTLLCAVVLFLLHLLYGFSIYLASK